MQLNGSTVFGQIALSGFVLGPGNVFGGVICDQIAYDTGNDLASNIICDFNIYPIPEGIIGMDVFNNGYVIIRG